VTLHLSLQIGRQSQAGASQADIVGFGGGAGGGKTEWLLKLAARHYDVKNYVAKIFRRTYPQIAGGGGMWDRTHEIYMPLGGKANHSELEYRFPVFSSSVGFSHLQHEKDKLNHQGKEYAFIGIDEATQFTWAQIWYLRSRNRTTCGVRPRMGWTFNPDPDHPIKEFLSWWLDEKGQFPDLKKAGVIRWFVRNEAGNAIWNDTDRDEFNQFVRDMIRYSDPHFKPTSFTFVPSSIDDNPALLDRDPGYKSRLMSLPLVERQQLLYGDWLIRPAAGTLFKREWFPILERRPARIGRCVRYWDRAATHAKPGTDPDYTAGVLVGEFDGGLVVLDVQHFRGTPAEVKRRIITQADIDRQMYDDVLVGIEEDPSQAGKFESDWYVSALLGHNVKAYKARDSKIKRAEPASAQAEQGKLYVMREQWLERFIAELENFPTGTHDDMVDALSGAVMAIAETHDPFAAWK
jgi:predicted phage terminase large subunit-like protein